MKGLPPSLKPKKRYIAFKILSEREISQDKFLKALLSNMLNLFGECFAAKSDISIEYFNDGKGIVRCNKEALDKVIIALTLINSVEDIKVVPLTLGVSGTIKRCKRKYLEG